MKQFTNAFFDKFIYFVSCSGIAAKNQFCFCFPFRSFSLFCSLFVVSSIFFLFILRSRRFPLHSLHAVLFHRIRYFYFLHSELADVYVVRVLHLSVCVCPNKIQKYLLILSEHDTRGLWPSIYSMCDFENGRATSETKFN